MLSLKVDSDLQVDSRPALTSCDFTARDGSSTLQKTPEIPPPVDLDAPMKSEQQLINLGWSSDYVNVKVHVDALWKAACMKDRSQSEVMNVSDLVSDGDGSLSRSMETKATITVVKERIWIM